MCGELKHSHVRKLSRRELAYEMAANENLGDWFFGGAIITLLHNLAIYIIKPINIQNTSRQLYVTLNIKRIFYLRKKE